MTTGSGEVDGARVFDASALLAWLGDEPGAGEVEKRFEGSFISTVNLSEVLQKSLASGVGVEGMMDDLRVLGLTFVEFGEEEARITAELWQGTRPLGPSLADRACLATAIFLGLPALTADAVWTRIEREGLIVEVIR